MTRLNPSRWTKSAREQQRAFISQFNLYSTRLSWSPGPLLVPTLLWLPQQFFFALPATISVLLEHESTLLPKLVEIVSATLPILLSGPELFFFSLRLTLFFLAECR